MIEKKARQEIVSAARWMLVGLAAFLAHGMFYGFLTSPTISAFLRAASDDIFDRIDPRTIALDDVALILATIGAGLMATIRAAHAFYLMRR